VIKEIQLVIRFKKIRHALCVVLLMLNYINGIAQSLVVPQPVFENYTSDSGLPSSEIYHAYQDSLGYIWFATANGVSRFDGNKFENFDLDNGLVDNTIEEIYPDYKGRLWFISSSGKLAYYQKGTIFPYLYNDKIQKMLPATRGPVKNSFYIDRSENIYISFKKFGCLKISKDGMFQKLSDFYDEGVVVIDRFITGNALVVCPQKPKENILRYSDGENKYTWNYQKEIGQTLVYNFHTFASFLPDNSLIVSSWNFLFKLNKGEVKTKINFGSEIIWLSIDKSNNLWVAPSKGGVICFPNFRIDQEPSLRILSGMQITSILTDKENGVWFTTLNNGVYYTRNINARTYSKENDFTNFGLSSIYAKNNILYIGFDNGKLGVIEKNILNFLEPAKNIFFASTIRDIINKNNDEIWVLSSTAIHSLSNNKFTHYNRSLNNYLGIHPRQIISSLKGDFIIASAQGIKRFDGGRITYDSFILKEFSAVVYSVFEKPNGHILLGCANGLWSYDGKSYSYLGENEPLLSKQILSISGSNDGRIYLGTKGLGLVVINANGTLTQLREEDGIASQTVNQVYFDGEHIWLATSEGATRLSVNPNGTFKVLQINKSKGLPTNDVQKIFRYKNDILIGTRKGLTLLSADNLNRNIVVPLCHITKIRVNNSDQTFNDTLLQLNYSQKLIDISYKGLTFLNGAEKQYRYRMFGLDTTWVYTNNTNAIYSNLPSLKYTFEVQCQNNDGLWSETAKLNIYIKKAYWQTNFFIAISAFFFSLLIFIIYRIRITAIKRRNELINLTNLYKQQSLRQQMNPHFIFNTLNSIQLYILQNDPLNSQKYLTKFARLIRMTLDNSQEQYITVKDELEALRLYLELESLRLEDKLEFEVEVESPEINNLKIPTLLIQPFVENSIWHGIMLKDDKRGKIKVTVAKSNGLILCKVEDNGIGRKKALEIKDKYAKDHKSLGFKITSQRVEILNLIYRDKFSIDYIDLLDEHNQPSGTLVIIKIPVDQ
jgi:ligand-binding sensor domain-containing protein